MPTYEYECEKCAICFERVVPLSRFDEIQTCESCSSPAKRLISLSGVVFKGDGWASKNNRVAGQMRDKNRRVSARQEVLKREGPGVSLAPNVNGERTSSWSDAAKLAASQGKNVESYAPKIREETAAKSK